MNAIGLAPIATAAPSVGTLDAPVVAAVPVGVVEADPVTVRESVALEMVWLPEKLMVLEAEAWVAMVVGALVVDADEESDLEADEEADEVAEEDSVEEAADEEALAVLPDSGKGPQ
jgi:hypothetical protein